MYIYTLLHIMSHSENENCFTFHFHYVTYNHICVYILYVCIYMQTHKNTHTTELVQNV